MSSGISAREVHVAFSGDRLVTARIAAELTQPELAQAVGSSRQRISEWENGLAVPRAQMIPALARALDVDALALMAEDADHLELESMRLAAGLSFQAAATAVGTSVTRYQRLERGERSSEPPEDLVKQLARVLSVPAVTVRVAAERARDRHERGRGLEPE